VSSHQLTVIYFWELHKVCKCCSYSTQTTYLCLYFIAALYAFSSFMCLYREWPRRFMHHEFALTVPIKILYKSFDGHVRTAALRRLLTMWWWTLGRSGPHPAAETCSELLFGSRRNSPDSPEYLQPLLR